MDTLGNYVGVSYGQGTGSFGERLFGTVVRTSVGLAGRSTARVGRSFERLLRRLSQATGVDRRNKMHLWRPQLFTFLQCCYPGGAVVASLCLRGVDDPLQTAPWRLTFADVSVVGSLGPRSRLALACRRVTDSTKARPL